MKRGSFLVASSMVLGACGGGSDRAETIAEPALTESTISSPEPNERVSRADLQDSLLSLEDLPTGWTTMEDDEDEDQTSFCGEETARDKFPPIREAEARFQKSELGPFLSHALGLYEKPEEVLDYFVNAMNRCETWTDEQDGIETVFTLKPLSFPKYGDRTVALRFMADSEFVSLEGDMVVWKRGDVLSLLVNFGVGGVDSGQTKRWVEKADAKL